MEEWREANCLSAAEKWGSIKLKIEITFLNVRQSLKNLRIRQNCTNAFRTHFFKTASGNETENTGKSRASTATKTWEKWRKIRQILSTHTVMWSLFSARHSLGMWWRSSGSLPHHTPERHRGVHATWQLKTSAPLGSSTALFTWCSVMPDPLQVVRHDEKQLPSRGWRDFREQSSQCTLPIKPTRALHTVLDATSSQFMPDNRSPLGKRQYNVSTALWNVTFGCDGVSLRALLVRWPELSECCRFLIILRSKRLREEYISSE